MSEAITISRDEIVQQVKFSCQTPAIVEGILNRQVITRTAAEKGIKVEPEELQQAADNLRLVSNLRSAEATWSWLKQYSLSLDDFEELVYISALSSKLAKNLFGDKVDPFFIEHQIDYVQAIMYEAVLDDEDLAMELYYSLKENEISFYEVAHQYVQDKELRRAGGYRGKLHRRDLKPEICAAVFAATPPQILKPIVTSKGVHLILVEELIQPELDNLLRLKIISDLFSAWLKEQIEQVEILTQLDS
jgi:parvulin-like peptidyl-prolyl isomerase